MNFLIRLSLIAVLIFNMPTALAVSYHCGGDGPIPFSDVSSTLNFQVNAVNAQGGVDEFDYLQQRDALIYRNGSNQVLMLGFDGSNYSKASYLSTSGLSLDRIEDPTERYLLTSNQGWIFDTQSQSWYHFLDAPVQHLFWSGSSLYSLASSPTLGRDGSTEYQIYNYNLGDPQAALTCSFSIQSPDGLKFALSRGNQFPYIYFYSSQSQPSGYVLHNYRYDVVKCKFEDEGTQFAGIRGAIKGVDRFPASGGVAVQVDNPTENLLWWTTDGCRYFNIDGLEPIVPDHNQSTIATWSKNTGVHFFFLDEQKEASVLNGFPIQALTDRDVWISADQKHVFISPQFQGENFKWMLAVKNLILNPINLDLAATK